MSLSLICTTLAVLMVITPSLPAQQMSWPTYHGQPSLDGYTKMALPDRINLVWRLKTEGSLSLTPVSDGMRLFYASERGEVGAVNLHGERVWSTAITNRVRAPLVALPSALIVACESGEVFSLDASSGKTNWMFRTGDIIQGSPNFWCGSDGKPNQILLLTQPNGVLYAVKPQNGHFIWKSHETTRTDGSPAVDGNLVVFGNCSASFHLFSAETGEKVGEIPVGEGCEMAGGVALSSGWIFAGNRRGTLAAADTSTRRVVWTNRDAEGEELFTTPAVSGERVVFPASNGFLYCLDRSTGKKLWQYRFGDAEKGATAVIARDKVVLAAGGTLWVVRLTDGTFLWKQQVSDKITSPCLVGGMIVVGTDEGALVAFGASKYER